MKRDFYEMMKNYDPAKDNEAPLSPDRVKEKAFEKIGALPKKQKIHLSRKFAVLAAAATVSITASLTVLAYELGAFDRAVSFFENKNAVEETKLDETDRNIIGKNLRENTAVANSDGTAIRLTGSMYDENMAYFFFELTAPEGTVFSSEQYDFKQNELDYIHNINGGIGWNLVFDDSDLTDNVTYFTLSMNCNGISIQDIYNLNLGDLCIVSDYPSEEEVILRGQWTIPLETGEPVEAIELCEKPSELKLENKIVDISSLKLSPLSLTFTSSDQLYLENTNIGTMDNIIISDNYNDAMLYGVEIFIKMKDGSMYCNINPGGGGSAGGNGVFTDIYYFDKPIDIDNVESVVIRGTEFKVN